MSGCFEDFIKFMKRDENEIKWLSLNKSITADNNAWQDHSTPDSICDQMVELYKSEFYNQQNILVLFNVEFIKSIYIKYDDVIYKNIYFVADTEKKYNWVKKNFSKINCVYFNERNVNKLNECIKGFNVKKFDVVFSNPPYNGNLDLKILKSLFEQKISKKIVFVHPAGYLLDKKFKTKLYNDIRNNNYLESVNMFWGNKLFDIKLTYPCCISTWNTNKTNDDCFVYDNAISQTKYVCKINDISIHPAWVNAWFKQLNYNKNLITELTPNGELTDYSVKFALIRGHVHDSGGYMDDYFTLICKDIETNKCDHTFAFGNHVHTKLHWAFNSEDERENFINYCKTKIVRFILSGIKAGNHLDSGELEVIPWLDFTKEWDDKKLCEEFGISEELWKYIDNFIPDYYDDYYSGFGVKNIIPAYRDVKPSKEMYKFVGEEVINKLMSRPLGNKCGNRNIKFKKDGKRYDMNRYDNGDGTFTWSVYRVG
jgi:hypothetical protein